MNKVYITANQLLEESYLLAMDIFEAGYKPDFIVGVWRGGTPVGIAVQELMAYLGHASDHIAIRTSSYTGIGQQNKEVKVHGLHYLVDNLKAGNSLLLVDDVFDSGRSIEAIIKTLGEQCVDNMPDIKVATPYYKPGNNKTTRVPDFYLHTTEDWLVFPHELYGLELDEIAQHKVELSRHIDRLGTLKSRA